MFKEQKFGKFLFYLLELIHYNLERAEPPDFLAAILRTSVGKNGCIITASLPLKVRISDSFFCSIALLIRFTHSSTDIFLSSDSLNWIGEELFNELFLIFVLTEPGETMVILMEGGSSVRKDSKKPEMRCHCEGEELKETFNSKFRSTVSSSKW